MKKKREFYSELQRKKVMSMLNQRNVSHARLPGTVSVQPEKKHFRITGSHITTKETDSQHRFAKKTRILIDKILRNKILRNRKILYGALVTASIITGSPAIIETYQIIKIVDFGIRTAKELRKRRFVDRVKMLGKMILQHGLDNVYEEKKHELAKELTETSQKTGIIKTISEKTSVSESLTYSMFHGTAINILDKGGDKITDLALEVV